jgi:putative N6-adenine-specific DNA methylase
MSASERRLKILGAKPHAFRAVCPVGFESISAQELASLGIQNTSISYGALDFEAKFMDVAIAQAQARTITRFVMRIAEFKATNFMELKHHLGKIPLPLYLPIKTPIVGAIPCGCPSPEPSLKISVATHKSRLYHQDAIAEVVQNTISDFGFYGHIYLRFDNDRCQVSVDLSGDPLYKRSTREWVEDAPLRETMAAGILYAAEFWKYPKLIDPMSGSGVFSLEAASWLTGENPRSFACEQMPLFKEAQYKYALNHPVRARLALPQRIETSDISEKSIQTIQHNFVRARLALPQLHLSKKDFFKIPNPGEALLVLNPPYGKRLAHEKNFYRDLGQKLRKDFNECGLAILAPQALLKETCVHFDQMLETKNGGLSVALALKKPAPVPRK